MNPYFIMFSAYALFIAPIRLHLSLRIGKRMSYRVRVQLVGLPLIRRTEEQPQEEQQVREEEVAQTLALSDWRPVILAIREGWLKWTMKRLRIETLYLHARLSFDDAALNAISYAFLRTLLDTLSRCGFQRGKLFSKLEMDFFARGTEVFVRGIISARLGSLGIAALWLGAVYVNKRSDQARTEEDSYAAASH